VGNLGSDVQATAPVDEAEDEVLKEIALRWTPVGGGTMTDHPHIELFRRTYAAFTTGDMDALAEVFAEDVVWHTPGHNPLSGDYEGRDATFNCKA
jgi:SnoaL-like domain